jgi:PAS domain S-box-containing protein
VVTQLLEQRRELFELRSSESLREEAVNALVATKIDLEQRIELRTRDVRTAQRRAEESERQLSRVYDTVGDVLFLLDVEPGGQYRFASVNRAFLGVTGLKREQVVGKAIADVIPEPSLSIVLRKYEEALRTREVVRWEETSDYPSGRLTGEVTIAAVSGESGERTWLVGAVHDITRYRAQRDAMCFVLESELGTGDELDLVHLAAAAAVDGVILEPSPPLRGRWDGRGAKSLLTRLFAHARQLTPGQPVRVRVEGSPGNARLVITAGTTFTVELP